MAQTAQLITTPFGRETTAAEVVEGIDLKGKRAVVTGGGSGIGVETARALAGAGAAVTLAVRRPADGEKVAEDIRSSTGNDEVRRRAPRAHRPMPASPRSRRAGKVRSTSLSTTRA